MPTMLPLMDKDTVRYITLNITPEETEYVAGIKSTIDDTKATAETSDDVIYLTKIIAFYTKFKTLNWTSDNNSYKMQVNDFTWRLEQYRDDIAENIQAIVGQIKGGDITKLELPISDNPLEVINELKQCVLNWFMLHQDDIEYEGARSLTSLFLAYIHKFIYIFRLCKVSTAGYGDTVELPNPTAGLVGTPTTNPIAIGITPESLPKTTNY